MMWYKIPGFDLYEIDKAGNIRSYVYHPRKLSPRPVKGTVNKSGHIKVTLQKDGKPYQTYLHTLMLLTFVGERPPGMEGRHLDDNPANNNLENLIWGTHTENMNDIKLNGNNFNANLTHCPENHEYTKENTYVYKGRRNCRICRSRQMAAYKARNKLEIN